jgi:hypothetical protein
VETQATLRRTAEPLRRKRSQRKQIAERIETAEIQDKTSEELARIRAEEDIKAAREAKPVRQTKNLSLIVIQALVAEELLEIAPTEPMNERHTEQLRTLIESN